MARKDVPEAVADRVLDRFEEVGLVDDAAYAGMLVRTRQAERGLARRALAVELRRKGIDAVTAQEALAEVDGDDEIDAARAVVAKRLRSMSGLDVEVKRRRLVATLAPQGAPAGTQLPGGRRGAARPSRASELGRPSDATPSSRSVLPGQVCRVSSAAAAAWGRRGRRRPRHDPR